MNDERETIENLAVPMCNTRKLAILYPGTTSSHHQLFSSEEYFEVFRKFDTRQRKLYFGLTLGLSLVMRESGKDDIEGFSVKKTKIFFPNFPYRYFGPFLCQISLSRVFLKVGRKFLLDSS